MKMIVYGYNDYRDYLAHHGVLGQKWGKKNGPPYPLAYGDHSAMEKKAGWQDSLKKKREQKKIARKIKNATTNVIRSQVDETGKIVGKSSYPDLHQYDVAKLPEIRKVWDELSDARNELEAAYKERGKAIDAYNTLSYSDRMKLINNAADWDAWAVANDEKEYKKLRNIYKKTFQEGDFSADGEGYLDTPFSEFTRNSKYGAPDRSLEYKDNYDPKRVGRARSKLYAAQRQAVRSLLGEYGDTKISKLDSYTSVEHIANRALDNLREKESDHFYEEREFFVKTYR